MRIFALHGFLGKPTDWNFLKENLIQPVEAVDILQKIDTFEDWSQWLNNQAKLFLEKKILLGYSLGGRLAMHALLQKPHLWDAAIIISAHTGLSNQQEKNHRKERDRILADRFKEISWQTLMEEWENQTIFQSATFRPKREEKEYQREIISEALEKWSLGNQNVLKQKIESIDKPILWVAGENDIYYSAIARALNLKHKNSQVSVFSQCGHRVPWEKQEIFIKKTKEFLHTYDC